MGGRRRRGACGEAAEGSAGGGRAGEGESCDVHLWIVFFCVCVICMDVDIRLNTPGNFTSLPAVDTWAEKYKIRTFNPRIVSYYGPLAENSNISPKTKN